MTKTKRILILPALLTLSFAGIAGKGMWLTPKMQGETLLQEEYKINTLFKLPTLEKDGITYDATIEFPSGATYFESEVLLTEVGVYTLHFTAEKDGKFYSEEQTFLVRSPYVGFSGTKSFSSFENSERTYNHEGLFVSLAEGETLTFNDKIDLSKGGDIISFYVAPSMLGNMDFSELYITITEVANPKNAITARAKASGEGVNNPYTYWAVKAGEQQLTGLEVLNGKENLHINNDFGTSALHSFYGLYPGYPTVKAGDAKLTLSYNKSENAAYGNTMKIADFDDPKFFTRLWDGFASDLVTVSISAKGYSGSSATFVVTSLLGKDLSKETIIDTKGPEITVDFPYTKTPMAKKGYRYPIFKATALDEEDGECSVKTRVYYNYGSDKSTLVEIVDNSFLVSQKGVYGIVYEAKDKMGNVSKKVILVSTDEAIPPLDVKAPIDTITSLKQGEIYNFPKMIVEGGSGNKETSFEVYLNNEKYVSEKEGFIPKDIGTYEIVSKTTDIIGQTKEVRYNLEVAANDGAVLYDDIVFPKYYISGGVYTLPTAICYDYSSGKAVATPMEVIISNGAFTYEAVSGDSFVPQVTGSQEDLNFTYHYKNLSIKKSVTTINPYVRKAGVERFAIQNFLITDNVNLDVGDSNLGVYAKTRGDASFTFANAINAENSSIQLGTDPGKEDFKAIEVTFSDSLSENEKVTMKIQRNASDNIDFKIDKRSYPTKSSFATKNGTLTFGYSDGYFSFESMGIEANVYDNGEAFNGFSSGKIYISMTLKDAKTGAGIRLAKIDNQSMAYDTDDHGVPRIIIHGDYGGTYCYGDLATINRVESSDVLDPNSVVTVTVHDPSGNIVKDVNGVSLENVQASQEYQIQLNGFGQFIVTYEAHDTAGNSSSFIYAINVEDDVAPTIEVTGSLPKTVKVGDSVRVPSFKVSDDQDKEVEATVYITTSHGEVIYLGNHNAFKPKYEGTYTLRIRAMDKAGNVSYVDLSFEVTK